MLANLTLTSVPGTGCSTHPRSQWHKLQGGKEELFIIHQLFLYSFCNSFLLGVCSVPGPCALIEASLGPALGEHSPIPR